MQAPQNDPGPLPAAALAMYERDRASQLLGIELVEVEPGRAVVSMVVRDDMVNGLDVCHGGFLFTLADTAMAFASNADDQRAFASHADIDFLNPAPLGARLTASSRIETTRAKLMVHDVIITTDDPITVAVFRGRTITVGGSVTGS